MVFYKRWQAKGKAVWLVNTLMYIYLAFVLYFTLMPVLTAIPFMFNHPYSPMNLVPFIDVTTGRGDYFRQVVLNIIMTVPFGILLPLIDKVKPSFYKTITFTFLLSLSIELLQPLLSGFRTADITDLITNVLGGAIGYLVYLIMRPCIMKFLRYFEEPKKLNKN